MRELDKRSRQFPSSLSDQYVLKYCSKENSCKSLLGQSTLSSLPLCFLSHCLEGKSHEKYQCSHGVQLFFTSSIQLSPTGVKVNKGTCIEIYKIAADLHFSVCSLTSMHAKVKVNHLKIKVQVHSPYYIYLPLC